MLPGTSSFTKKGSQNWHAMVMFKVFNQNWAWWVTNTNEGYYSFPSLQTNFLFLFSSVASEACITALPHSERKRPGRAISCGKKKKSVGLFICWEERGRGDFISRIQATKPAWNQPALGKKFPWGTRWPVLCPVQHLLMEPGCFKIEPNIKNRTPQKHHH